MEFTDRTLRCVECGEDFVFSADEQIYFMEKEFLHDPKHCKKCKARRVNRLPRLETSVTCAQCGSLTVVPFLPNQGRPVLCRSCFRRRRVDASLPHGIALSNSKHVEAVKQVGQDLAGCCGGLVG
jgi:CxxC-x17-CxxC domain-containing protein